MFTKEISSKNQSNKFKKTNYSSRCGAFAVVLKRKKKRSWKNNTTFSYMKNCDPLVFGPRLAIDSR
jgi:hypothetical protein